MCITGFGFMMVGEDESNDELNNESSSESNAVFLRMQINFAQGELVKRAWEGQGIVRGFLAEMCAVCLQTLNELVRIGK